MGPSFAPDESDSHPQAAPDFLRGWLLTHIHGADKLPGAFLQGL